MLRLLFALILAVAAPPMPVAACDDAIPVAASGHAMSGMDRSAPMPVAHDCIGCIAVADWNGARIAPPVSASALPLAVRVVVMRLLPGQAPTLPPPRVA